MFHQIKHPVGDKMVGLAASNCLKGDAETSTLCELYGERRFSMDNFIIA